MSQELTRFFSKKKNTITDAFKYQNQKNKLYRGKYREFYHYQGEIRCPKSYEQRIGGEITGGLSSGEAVDADLCNYEEKNEFFLS